MKRRQLIASISAALLFGTTGLTIAQAQTVNIGVSVSSTGPAARRDENIPENGHFRTGTRI